MPDHVLKALDSSAISDIHIVGRRGPAQAKFTTKELRELGELAGEASGLIGEFDAAIRELESANLDENHPDGDLLEGAKYIHDTVVPAMGRVRELADRLEKVVADDLWPLPKYSEMLFIK